MKLEKFTEHIYLMPGEERTDRPFLYYVKGRDFGVAIDAGNSREHVELFYSELKKWGLPLPEYTIITHWHWDHTFGMYAAAGITMASVLTNEKLREVGNRVWTPEKMKEREETGEDIAFCNNCILEEYKNLEEIKVIPAMREISGPEVLDMGDVKLHLIPRDSTHSRDSMFIYIPQDRALVVGDADCEDYYENNAKYDKRRLEELIEFLESMDYEHHILGHVYPEKKEQALGRLRKELKEIG